MFPPAPVTSGHPYWAHFKLRLLWESGCCLGRRRFRVRALAYERHPTVKHAFETQLARSLGDKLYGAADVMPFERGQRLDPAIFRVPDPCGGDVNSSYSVCPPIG